MAYALEVMTCIFQNWIFFAINVEERIKKKIFRSVLNTYKDTSTILKAQNNTEHNIVSKQNRKPETFLSYTLFRKQQDNIMTRNNQ